MQFRWFKLADNPESGHWVFAVDGRSIIRVRISTSRIAKPDCRPNGNENPLLREMVPGSNEKRRFVKQHGGWRRVLEERIKQLLQTHRIAIPSSCMVFASKAESGPACWSRWATFTYTIIDGDATGSATVTGNVVPERIFALVEVMRN